MAKKNQLLSMTGFGRGRAVIAGVTVEAELKSVNHRYLDVSCKLPRGYQEFESEIRAQVAEWIERGRVEVTIQRQAETSVSGVFSEKNYQEYMAVYQRLLGRKALEDPTTKVRVVTDILAKKEVLGPPEDQVVASREERALKQALEKALEAHLKMRSFEGTKLSKDVSARIATLGELVEQMKIDAARDPQAVRERLTARIKKLAPEVLSDQSRLASEIVYLVDRSDITEEFVRLESHFAQAAQILNTPPQGRKLEFLLQELGREFNTIGSKGQDPKIQHGVVQAKVELEKIREQLQNVA